MSPAPCGYGNDLIGAELQASVCAGGVMSQQNVHDSEELLEALVLAQVLPPLHQEGVVPLVIPTDDETFGTANGGHHLYLQGMNSNQLTGRPAERRHAYTQDPIYYNTYTVLL